MPELTPIDAFDGWCAKREDLACHIDAEHCSGAKVRQFMKMVANHPKGTPMVVGCSQASSQQLYITDAARRVGCEAHVFVPSRKQPTSVVQWCEKNGAKITYIKPGYPAVYRAAARKFAKSIGGCIKWNVESAIADAAEQVENVPGWVKRIVVPTGSGLTAIGVAIGLIRAKRQNVEVVCHAVSEVAQLDEIVAGIQKRVEILTQLPIISLSRDESEYGTPRLGTLPNGTLLDCNYVAKALPQITQGDCLWVSGMRPAEINK